MTQTMKAWRLERLGGQLSLQDIAIPEVRPGGVLVKIEASSLMSYLKAYVEGRLPIYRPPAGAFTPGGNGVGVVQAVGRDVWHLVPGQRVMLSSHLLSVENVPEPAQILIGVTSFGGAGDAAQADWRDGTLAEYALFPVSAVTPIDGFDGEDVARLTVISRCAIPFGGLLRGRLAAGETVIITGATGAYGSAAVLVAVAMGASRVVAAGRNIAALDALTRAGGPRVTAVALSGDVATDAAALRQAADGGAHLAFDMVGGASDPHAPLAALNALRRGGRLVLMGSMTAKLPLDYIQLMANNLEVIGNFMHHADAYRRLFALLRSGQLDISPIVPKVFPLAQLPAAMDAAATAHSLECVVVQS